MNDKLLKDMTEPELSEHVNNQLKQIHACETADTVVSVLIIIGEDGICQYGSTAPVVNSLPQILTTMANAISSGQNIRRDSDGT